MNFRKIDVKKDEETIVKFRKDSYLISFGSLERFGDEYAYVERIADRAMKFPEGIVLVEEHNKVIGQMELQIVKYEGKDIGYVHLYYLIPEYRGKGYGKDLMAYSERFFRKNGMTEYHLRVSPANQGAMHFYLKAGMEKLQEEKHDYVVWRMRKFLDCNTTGN
ncbi:GNAT family N-acetyltransferase [Bacillus sp. V59.32b]|uniref:GNAT family N-acetyltransferase n=1 Tax=Bacillus sp. V59.32b TaxID=1758642 RepID=UPI000E3CCB9D|nr:GNAT family N-acetyltransferase [Bacillus sp. V59.32b]RFU66199.1 GNAT family N-acetyltransferase [Bacillus sp. V59.32b]